MKQSNLKLKFILFLTLVSTISFAQTDTSKTNIKDIIHVNGYVKYMQTASFADLNYISTDQLIHNRINTKAYINDNITLKLEFRNRIFYGDQVRLFPQNFQSLENDNGWLDMSFLWLQEPAMFGHTTIDRALLDYDKGNLNIKLGRQRINWGINTAWNPND